MDDHVALDEVRRYRGRKNTPQQWYSKKQPFTLAWFNELAYKRFNVYYEHLRERLRSNGIVAKCLKSAVESAPTQSNSHDMEPE